MSTQQIAGDGFALTNLSDEAEGKFVVAIQATGDVQLQHGWKSTLARALEQLACYGKLNGEEIKRPDEANYYPESSYSGNALIVTAENPELLADVTLLVGLIVPAPKLAFKRVETDNDDGSETLTVFHDGKIADSRRGLSLPKTRSGVDIVYDGRLQKATITFANPLINVNRDKLASKVEAALQALSIVDPDAENNDTDEES